MASGWTPDDAVNKQIESSILDAIDNIRRQLNQNTLSANYCKECGEAIFDARKKAMPGALYCIQCQNDIDKQQKTLALYNRRGSKDSQLR